jgi:hypothetical protein
MKFCLKIIPLIFALTLVNSCSIFKKKGSINDIKIIYDNAQDINYGKKVKFKIIANYSSGKSKNIIGKKGVTINVLGASYNKDYFILPKYPSQLNDDIVYVSASYSINDKTYKDSIAIPYNYKGKVLLEFNGENGINGSDGKDGKRSLIFKDGNHGSDGANGANGTVGHDLQVYVWKENQMYFIKVIDMTNNNTYFYKANEKTLSYYFYVNGGSGGNGGKGGDGGNGKDAVKTEKKVKSAGIGGNGAKGGNGGNGAKGGNVYVFIHPNAKNFKSKIVIYNYGGKAGKAGAGGKAGTAGKDLDGQISKKNGKPGTSGVMGIEGTSGDVISIEIMEFDINDIKQTN